MVRRTRPTSPTLPHRRRRRSRRSASPDLIPNRSEAAFGAAAGRGADRSGHDQGLVSVRRRAFFSRRPPIPRSSSCRRTAGDFCFRRTFRSSTAACGRPKRFSGRRMSSSSGHRCRGAARRQRRGARRARGGRERRTHAGEARTALPIRRSRSSTSPMSVFAPAQQPTSRSSTPNASRAITASRWRSPRINCVAPAWNCSTRWGGFLEVVLF